jgi:hypothetical protein
MTAAAASGKRIMFSGDGAVNDRGAAVLAQNAGNSLPAPEPGFSEIGSRLRDPRRNVRPGGPRRAAQTAHRTRSAVLDVHDESRVPAVWGGTLTIAPG